MLTAHERQSCRLVSTIGHYYTINRTWSPDPAQALTSERWFIELQARSINVPTVVIRER